MTKIVHYLYRFSTGGLENGLTNIINGLPEGYEHHIVTVNGYDEVFAKRLKRPVIFFDLKKPDGKGVGHLIQLYRYLKKVKPDIIHTRNTAGLEALFVAMLAGVAYRVHSEHGRDFNDIDGRQIKYRLLRKFCLQFAHKVIALSKDLETYLMQTIGVSKRKMQQIYNGVDCQKFNPLPKETVSNKMHFISVGRLSAEKNHLLLLKACSQLLQSKDDINIQISIVGDGAMRATLENYIAEHQLTDHVELLGNRQDIPQCLSNADVFILPSIIEGVSNTILEAMACGKAIIATQVGGNSELIDTDCGQLIESNNSLNLVDAMTVYLNDASLSQRHGIHARQRVEALFSLEKMIHQYHHCYQKHHD